MPITYPFVAPSRASSASDFSDAYSLALTNLPLIAGQANILEANVVTQEGLALSYSLTTVASAVNSLFNGVLFASGNAVPPWVTGATYAIGNLRYSIMDLRIYRRKTAGAGSTDPSADATNWELATLEPSIELLTGLVTQAAVNGSYAFTASATEAAATNLEAYSEQPDNAYWAKGATITVTPNTALAPDGTWTAARMAQVTANEPFYKDLAASGTSSQSVTRYVKAGNVPSAIGVSLWIYWISNTTEYVNLTLNTVTGGITSAALTATGLVATSTHMGDGWYKLTLSGTGTNALNTSVRVLMYGGSASSDYLLWGCQREATIAPTSYIKTTTGTVTRPSGIVAPQRLILPANPVDFDTVICKVANGQEFNMLDPNGKTYEDVAGAIRLDSKGAKVVAQYLAGSWRNVA